MSEQHIASDGQRPADRAADVEPPTRAHAAPAAGSGDERPADPAERELAEVAEAMAQVRAGVPTLDAGAAVPEDAEVAGLERAHEALRATLDRVDRLDRADRGG